MKEFTGKANTVDNAIKAAAQKALHNQGPDAMVEFEVDEVRGVYGGIGGLHQIEVTIKQLNMRTLDLCDRAIEYRGFQKQGVVTVVAYGSHETSGYKVLLQQKPNEIFPPQYYLAHERPTGIALPVITPFVVSTHFHSTETITQIEVEDAKGRHDVEIAQVGPEAVLSVSDVQLKILKSNPPQLSIHASGSVPTPGWSNAELVPFMYIAPPRDGIYDFTFMAIRPTDIEPQVITEIEAGYVMKPMPDNVKGVRIHAKDNNIVAMLDMTKKGKIVSESVIV